MDVVWREHVPARSGSSVASVSTARSRGSHLQQALDTKLRRERFAFDEVFTGSQVAIAFSNKLFSLSP